MNSIFHWRIQYLQWNLNYAVPIFYLFSFMHCLEFCYSIQEWISRFIVKGDSRRSLFSCLFLSISMPALFSCSNAFCMSVEGTPSKCSFYLRKDEQQQFYSADVKITRGIKPPTILCLHPPKAHYRRTDETNLIPRGANIILLPILVTFARFPGITNLFRRKENKESLCYKTTPFSSPAVLGRRPFPPATERWLADLDIIPDSSP